MNIRKIICEEIDDFEWAKDHEIDKTRFDYYIITSESAGGDLNPDEWVLIRIIDRGHSQIRYTVDYHNLRPGRGWGSGNQIIEGLEDLKRLVGLPFHGRKATKPHWFPITKEGVPEKTYPDNINNENQ